MFQIKPFIPQSHSYCAISSTMSAVV